MTVRLGGSKAEERAEGSAGVRWLFKSALPVLWREVEVVRRAVEHVLKPDSSIARQNESSVAMIISYPLIMSILQHRR